MNDVVTVRKTLVDERHEGFLTIRKPFTIMLGFFGLEVGGLFSYSFRMPNNACTEGSHFL